MKKKDFEELVGSIRQAGKIRSGKAKPGRITEFVPGDVRAIRQRLDKSQSESARMIGGSVDTLQNWEQDRRRPDGPARAPLRIASENPEVVLAVRDE